MLLGHAGTFGFVGEYSPAGGSVKQYVAVGLGDADTGKAFAFRGALQILL